MKRKGDLNFGFPLVGSLVLHVGVVAFLTFYRGGESHAAPQTMSVRLVAAPAGERKIGVVTETPPKEAPKPTAKTAPQRENPKVAKTPIKTPTKVDPTKSTTVASEKTAKASSDAKVEETKASRTPPVAEKAGGGDVGGKGTDVTTATFVGLDFPDEAYLRSIINKIMEKFAGPFDQSHSADFEFVIDREGCIMDAPKPLRRSGSSRFNANAETAIIKAAEKCGFSKLPAVWKEDILRVHFRFDPKVIRGR